MASSDSRDRDPGGKRGEERDALAGLQTPHEGPVPDLHGLFGELQQQLEAERGVRAWLRSRSTPTRLAIAGSALLGVAVIVVTGWLRPDHGVYPLMRMLGVLLVISALITVDLLLALWPLQRAALPRWLHVAGTFGALLGLAAIYALPAAHEAHPASVQAPGIAALMKGALRCLGVGMVLAVAVYGFLRALDRGGADRALLAGACSGFAANLALQLHCPITLPTHMLVGHLGVAVLFVGGLALYARARRR